VVLAAGAGLSALPASAHTRTAALD